MELPTVGDLTQHVSADGRTAAGSYHLLSVKLLDVTGTVTLATVTVSDLAATAPAGGVVGAATIVTATVQPVVTSPSGRTPTLPMTGLETSHTGLALLLLGLSGAGVVMVRRMGRANETGALSGWSYGRAVTLTTVSRGILRRRHSGAARERGETEIEAVMALFGLVVRAAAIFAVITRVSKAAGRSRGAAAEAPHPTDRPAAGDQGVAGDAVTGDGAGGDVAAHGELLGEHHGLLGAGPAVVVGVALAADQGLPPEGVPERGGTAVDQRPDSDIVGLARSPE